MYTKKYGEMYTTSDIPDNTILEAMPIACKMLLSSIYFYDRVGFVNHA